MVPLRADLRARTTVDLLVGSLAVQLVDKKVDLKVSQKADWKVVQMAQRKVA